MIIKAEAKFIRQSPRKLRLVADLIRPMTPNQALSTLKHLPQAAAVPIYKALKQAVANAVNNHNQSQDSLILQSIEVNQGPIYKRWNPVSRGRAHPIHKKTSHIKIVLKAQKLVSQPTKQTKPSSATKTAKTAKTVKAVKANKIIKPAKTEKSTKKTKK